MLWSEWRWVEKAKAKGARTTGRGKTCQYGLQAKRCWALVTRAKVRSDQPGQSVPDVVNDTLLDPDLTRALCILHYQTLGSLKLHYLHRSSPPSTRERGERGQRLSWPERRTEATFPSRSDWYSTVSSASQSSPSSTFFFTPLLPLFCAGNLLDITTPPSALEHPGRSCPQGFLGRYQTHTGHSSLCCVDVGILISVI